jgi:hypothetical protein
VTDERILEIAEEWGRHCIGDTAFRYNGQLDVELCQDAILGFARAVIDEATSTEVSTETNT